MITTASMRDKVNGLRLVSLIWLAAIGAAAGVALWQGLPARPLAIGALIALVPAVASLALASMSDREWVRVLVMLLWTGLAVAACFAISLMPMAFLFLCAPAMAVLFKREMVVEAMVLSALAFAAMFALTRFGMTPNLSLPAILVDWAKTAGPAATLVLMIGAMFAVASRDDITAAELTDSDAAANDDLPVSSPLLPGLSLLADKEGGVLDMSAKARLVFGPLDKYRSKLEAFIDIPDENAMSLPEVLSASIASGTSIEKTVSRSANDDTLTFAMAVEPDGDTAIILLTDISSLTKDMASKNMPNLIPSHAATDLENEQSTITATQTSENDKSLFFAGVSHELRTPLNAIIGFSDMMRSRLFGPLPGKYAEYADLIHDSGQHMLDLIGDVLDMSKIEAGQYELSYDSFDMVDVVRSSLKMLRPSADAAEVVLDVDIAEADPVLINADRRAVRQVLLNLLSNAIKFSPKGGRVITHLSANEHDLTVKVSDSGSGMSASELQVAGTPYVQTKSGKESEYRGSGLGLSLVKSLVDLHGGQFDLQSARGAGTDASVTLPLAGDSQL